MRFHRLNGHEVNEFIIMKLGGSIITYKNRWMPTLNKDNLKRLAKEIGEAWSERKDLALILIHGAGSYGHVLATLYKILKENEYERRLLGFAEIQRLQNELNAKVCAELQNYHVPAVPVQASASAVLENEKLVHMDVKAIEGMLHVGLVPVLYGVPAYDKKLGGGILSGDEIMRHLAKHLEPDRLVHVSDVDGIYDKDPKKSKDAKLIKEITRDNLKQVLEVLGGSSYFDVTGGMVRKIEELMELEGIVAEIINGNREGYVRRALLGEVGLGTVIRS